MLANQGLCHSSLKSYLEAIRHLHIAESFGDPHIHSMAKLEQVLRGIKLVQCKKPKRSSRLPIYPDHLDKMRAVWLKDPITFDGVVFLWLSQVG